MPKYVIERNMPGAGKLSARDIGEAAIKSNKALHDLGPDVQWLHSYVTDNKVYCVYYAKNPDLVKEHAKRAGFPADAISTVRSEMDVATAETI